MLLFLYLYMGDALSYEGMRDGQVGRRDMVFLCG
jgi:hypothetical protein